MNQADAIQQAKEGTAEVPAGARERVWRRLGEQRPAPAAMPAWSKGLAFAACAAAGFLLVSTLRAPPAAKVFDGETSVAVATGEVTQGSDGVLKLGPGRLLVSSWGLPPVQIVALQHSIEAEVAVFAVEVAAQALTVDVREGFIRIDGERVEAGTRWPSGSPAARDYAPLTRLEPARAPEDRAWALAEIAVQKGDYPQALERFNALGGGGLRAEGALLKKGELQLRKLNAPAAALSTFDEALRRFPSGSLTQELALSSLEASLALEKWTDARARANDFLARFPQSERLLDVRYVSALAAWQLDDKSTTCAEIRGLQTSAFNGERRTTLEKLAAQCTLFER
jgi:hypothetical protein